jgi:hypothetical protein
MNWLQLVLSLLQMAPGILQSIQQAEQTITAPKSGPTKKAIVQAPVIASGAPAEVQTAVSQIIDSIVAAKNAEPKST